MKKKLIAVCLCVAMVAVAVIGGTLAYFTDTDEKTNVFTTGNVAIDLLEVFDEENAKLLPGIDIQKEVTVQNTGSEDAYVRVHIAVPAILDNIREGADSRALHWMVSDEALADGQWLPLTDEEGGYFFYTATVGDIAYNVYVFTYETVLTAEQVTATPAISQVQLDAAVTNEQLAEFLEVLGEIKILVFAEGGQAAGFTDAVTALNTQFGDPAAEGYVAPWNP